MPNVRQLYQTLNGILHRGPVFNRESPLAQPLRLTRLIIRIYASGPVESTDSSASETASLLEPFTHICDFVENLKKTGLLWGHVDDVRIIDEKSQREQDTMIELVENAGVPTSWDRYGFEWGTDKINK